MGDKRRPNKTKKPPRPVVQRDTLPPLKVTPGQKFKADVRRLAAAGKSMTKLEAIIDMLATRMPLPAARVDHALKGKLIGYRDCHIEGDWVLIYAVTDTDLLLYRTGTHSQLDRGRGDASGQAFDEAWNFSF